jgi:hypothetical protein
MKGFDSEHVTFLNALHKFLVKYVVIGGHAAIYYGVNRNTGDLDILIEPTVQNGHRLINVFNFLKLDVPTINDAEWTTPLVLSFGFEPDAIDILNYSPGISFDEVYKNSINVNQGGVEILIIDIRDLIKNKEALNRTGEKAHLDKYDIEVLKRIIEKRQ